MTTDRPLDETIGRWLEAEAPTQLPDRVLRATFERTRRTRQQGGWQAVLGRLQVNRMFAAVAGVAAVVVVGLIAGGLYFNQPGGIGGVPTTPTQAPSPTAEPTATPPPIRTPDAVLPVGPFSLEDFGMVMTVDIPAPGWSFGDSWNGVSKGVERDNLPEARSAFWAHPDVSGFDVYADPCRWASTTPETVTAVDDFAAALAAQASRDASEPADVMIGGYAGKSLILHVPDDADFSECDRGTFASYGRAGAREPDRWHQGPGQIDQFWILDVDGTIVTIQGMWRPDTPAELVEELRGIVESTTFETP